MSRHDEGITQAAIEAVRQGYQPIPIREGDKRPYGTSWQHTRWAADTPDEEITEHFERMAANGAPGLGLLLGAPSGGLLDVDLDHPLTLRMRDYFLPPSPMETGRAGTPRSHRWYIVNPEDGEELPPSRRYKMPDGAVSVELRSTRGQTVIPPSMHPSGEQYRWEGEPWGGEQGPEVVDGRKLSIQVALLGMAAVLMENWPKQGARHEAYLHLAGGLLRYGDGVHEYWERNLPVLISAIADATHDDDGPDSRVAEVMGTTITKLREGVRVTGFPSLGEVIGADHAEMVRRMAKEVESLSGFVPEVRRTEDITGTAAAGMGAHTPDSYEAVHGAAGLDEAVVSELPPEQRNPLEERVNSWAPVDLDPYLSGEVTMPEPSVLRREDGQGLFYPGRVNSLYGKSESAKSWLALYACVQEMGRGDRVVYLDLEDEPAGTLARVQALGAGSEDIRNQFRYVHPEGPLAAMQKYRFGSKPTDDGMQGEAVFGALLESVDPTLIIVDGMTVLYGLHGHDTNEATATDVITSWLKSLCRGGRTTVIVIDHTGKGGGPGASPIGAHHKVAMIQGTALRADAVVQPMPGEVGYINLVVYKDRPGAVRQISTKGQQEQIAAEVVMDSREEGVTRMEVKVPDGSKVVIGATEEMERKLEALSRLEANTAAVVKLYGGDLKTELKTPEVVAQLGLRPDDVYDVWRNLQNQGIVKRMGSTRSTRYVLNGPDALDMCDTLVAQADKADESGNEERA